MSAMHRFMAEWHLPGAVLSGWLALLALLALTVVGAYQPIGSFNTVLALTIAAGKAVIIALIFMELRHDSPVTISVAGAGFFWLGVMLWLALADFLTR
jgi:cytochrome c oxidase subunit 4